MACSLRVQIHASGLAWLSIFKRSFMLFFIGFLLQIIPLDQAPDSWRIMGVLQRIGLCFLLVAMMIATIKERWLLLTGVLVLIVYWLLLLTVGHDPYSVENNLVRHVDMAILGSDHIWQGKGMPFDPEGLLSTISAAITVLSGYLICSNVLQQKTEKQQILQLIAVGLVVLALGFVWSVWHPINKSLWTGSFVLVSSAFACFSLAAIILLWRVPVIKSVLHGLKIYGSNPIFIYVVAWVFAVFLNLLTMTIGQQSNSIKVWIYSRFQSVMTDKLASLLYAILFTALFYVIALVLYKKRIFIKL